MIVQSSPGAASKKRKHSYFLLKGIVMSVLAWLLYSCATPSAPQGGPRDETPPQIIAAESTPNMQTNFQKQTIELTFDEWVILEKVREEVVISPPLRVDPEIKLKRRTVQVIFPDTVSLRENVTYTINFGEAVKDLNEKNPAEDLRFVFSTGDYIDSLKIQGRITDALTGEPVEQSLFMLYENLADSVVRTERPLYFGKTGKDGRFTIENIREGVYKGFALEDKGVKKYLFEANERLALLDSLVRVSPDSTPELQLRLFTEALPLLMTKVDSTHFGKVKLIFNQPVYDLELDYENVVDTPLLRYENDSLIIWYQQERPWTLYLGKDTTFRDTVLIRAGRKAAFLANYPLKADRMGKTVSLAPGAGFSIRYNHPPAAFDTSLITLYVDTMRRPLRPELRVDTSDHLRVFVDYPWREEVAYQLEMLPGAVTDIFSLETTDTMITSIQLEPLSKYGNILLSLSGLDSTQHYLVQLLSKDLKQTLRADTVSGRSGYDTRWATIQPGDYTLRVVTDWNRNGRWDTGNYDRHLQPEPIYLRPLEKLRANWDLDATVQYGEVVATPEPEPPTQTQGQGGRRPGRN